MKYDIQTFMSVYLLWFLLFFIELSRIACHYTRNADKTHLNQRALIKEGSHIEISHFSQDTPLA